MNQGLSTAYSKHIALPVYKCGTIGHKRMTGALFPQARGSNRARLAQGKPRTTSSNTEGSEASGNRTESPGKPVKQPKQTTNPTNKREPAPNLAMSNQPAQDAKTLKNYQAGKLATDATTPGTQPVAP
jgi:hypothetical protein